VVGLPSGKLFTLLKDIDSWMLARRFIVRQRSASFSGLGPNECEREMDLYIQIITMMNIDLILLLAYLVHLVFKYK
jgi:hypothetical protein